MNWIDNIVYRAADLGQTIRFAEQPLAVRHSDGDNGVRVYVGQTLSDFLPSNPFSKTLLI